MRHRLLDECAQFVTRTRVDPELFVDIVVNFCLKSSLINELKQSIQKQGMRSANLDLLSSPWFSDPSLANWKLHLLAACRYFNERKLFKVLVTFQIFMEDFSRAALTCIKVFLETTEQSHRLKCLEVAKDYFAEAIRRLRNSATNPTSQPAPAPAGPSSLPKPVVGPPPASPGGASVLSMAEMEKCTVDILLRCFLFLLCFLRPLSLCRCR